MLVNPSANVHTDAEWTEHRSDLLDDEGALVLAIFGGPSGGIGAACLFEVTDAMGEALPIVALDQEGQLRHFGGFSRELGLVVNCRRKTCVST